MFAFDEYQVFNHANANYALFTLHKVQHSTVLELFSITYGDSILLYLKVCHVIFHHTTTQSPQAIYICVGVTRRWPAAVIHHAARQRSRRLINLSPTHKNYQLAKTEFKAQSTDTKFSQGAEEACVL